MSAAHEIHSAGGGAPLFPLVRHLSRWTTPLLLRLALTPNQITAASLVAGIAADLCFLRIDRAWGVAGGVMMVTCYVLDNCDGEIARIRKMATEFGGRFDTFVDWVVHAGFFLALGFGVRDAFGADFWLWLGIAAAAGASANYVLGLLAERGVPNADASGDAGSDLESPALPANWRQWILFAFRELARADFCFVLLIFALADAAWLLLPLGAVGAQVYWLTALVRVSRSYHV